MNILNSLKENVLNFFDYRQEKLIINIFNQAKDIYSEYNKFIEPYYSKNTINEWIKYIRDNKKYESHINGGISTSIQSFCNLDFKGNKIAISHDVNFIKLVKGRNDAIKKWIARINNLKKNHFEYQKYKKRKLDNFINNEEFKEEEVLKILSNNTKKFISKLNKLLINHGIPEHFRNDLINDILEYLYVPKSICTSGIKTFFNVLKKDYQILLNKADLTKSFCLTLTLHNTKKEHQDIYDKKINEIEIKMENSLSINTQNLEKYFNERYEKINKLIKPVEYKHEYYISFDIDDKNFEQFKKDINTSFENFDTKLKNFEKNGYFGEYFLTWEEKIKNRQEYIANKIKWDLAEIYSNPDNMGKLWEKPEWSIQNEDNIDN